MQKFLRQSLQIFVLVLWFSNKFNLLSCAYWPQRLKWKLTFFFVILFYVWKNFKPSWDTLSFPNFQFFWYFSRLWQKLWLWHTQVIHKLFNTFWKPLFNNFICVCILYLVLWWTFLYNYSQIFQRLSCLKNVWKDKNSGIYKNAYFFLIGIWFFDLICALPVAFFRRPMPPHFCVLRARKFKANNNLTLV